MTIFIVLFIYLILVSTFVHQKGNNLKTRLAQTILMGLGLWVVLALRSPFCGCDVFSYNKGYYDGYATQFVNIADTPFFEVLWNIFTGVQYASYEPGFVLYCRLVGLITNNVQLFLAITAAIVIFLFSKVIYRYSENIGLSFITLMCFGLYTFSFSGLRQALAIAITFYSYTFIDERKPFRFTLAVLLASTLHSSALFFLITYPLSKKTLTKVESLWAVAIILILLPFLSGIVNWITPILFPGKYKTYEDAGGAVTMFIVYIVLFFCSLFLKDRNSDNNPMRWMLLLATWCQSLGFISDGGMTRIGYYFQPIFILFFPQIINDTAQSDLRPILTSSLKLILLVFFILTMSGGYLNIVPYHFFWEQGFQFFL